MVDGFDFYFTVRPSIRMIPVNTTSLEDCFSSRLIKHLRDAFDAESAKSPIKGVVLCNPHNPLGRCYPRSVLAECLRFCQEKDIHFVSDEIYALSVFDAPDHTEAVGFESVLSLDLDVVGCDPSRVHAIWSMSKDFGCSGLRMVSNPDLASSERHFSISPY
jgi:gliotoxin/aspirochlorine biosynthesis aminotransferase